VRGSPFSSSFAQPWRRQVRGWRRGERPPHLLLQPAWGNSQGEALAVAFVQSHPAWRLSLQSHKWLGVR